MRYFYGGDASEDDDPQDGGREEEGAAPRAGRRPGRDAGDPEDDADGGTGDPDADGRLDEEEDPDPLDDAEEDDDGLEDDFPRGDGTADTSAVVFCPYCGELNDVAVDPGSGSAQSYIEDCQVCCRPWRVTVSYDGAGHAIASVEAADDL